MKVIRTYNSRKKAEEVANYLMSKGVATTIESNDILNNFKSFDPRFSQICLKVQDCAFDRAEKLLMKKENTDSHNLPKFSIFGIKIGK